MNVGFAPARCPGREVQQKQKIFALGVGFQKIHAPNKKSMPAVGYEHLRQHLRLSAFAPPRPALVKPVLRMDASDAFIAVPAAMAPEADNLLGHVLFALKHEGTDLQILAVALAAQAQQ